MADWWLSGGIDPANCVAAYQAIGAESYAASLVNLANPGTNDAIKSWTNDPPWSAENGWQFTGRDAADTLKAGTLVPRITWSAFVRVANAQYGVSGRNNLALGNMNSGNGRRFHLNPTYAPNGNNLFGLGDNFLSIVPPLVNGTMGLTGGKMWLDTTLKGDLAPTVDNITDPIYIGGVPNTGDVTYGDILAVAIYDTVLTDEQAIAVIEAMNALPTSPEPTQMLVSGAGSTEVNGIYTEDGVENGRPVYRMGDIKIFYWYGTWLIRSEAQYFYMCSEDVPTPDLGEYWEVDDAEEPAPTVTLYTGDEPSIIPLAMAHYARMRS